MDEDDFGDVSLEDFRPVMASSLGSAVYTNDSALKTEPYLFIGTVRQVLPPSSPFNSNKQQYEYLVAVVGELETHKSITCILNDNFGGPDDFDTKTLKTGARVAVLCAQASASSGVIVTCLSNRPSKVDESLGHHWMQRFNQISKSITKDNEFYVKHDNGNEIRIEPTKIQASDAEGNQVILDKSAKTIVITDSSGETITIDRNTNRITIEAKDLNLEVKGNLKANVRGDADITAKNINLNGKSGQVVTTNTHPFDFVTGIKIKGVKKVKAG